jgi:CheY-like chemotaxis protein
LSLTGNLEDLPLLDILQIVTYSRKTGYLAIDTKMGQGAIVFHDGLVVAAFTPESDIYRPEPGADAQKRAAAVNRRIEIALEKLTRLREGQFQFSLTDDTPTVVGTRDISLETVTDGINPQGLLLELARGIDEDRRDSAAALEASFAQPPDDVGATTIPPGQMFADVIAKDLEQVEEAEIGPLPDELVSVPPDEVSAATEPSLAPPAPAAAAAVPEEPPALLLVDDESDVRQVLAESFTGAGYQVIEAEDTDAAVKKANRLGKAGIRFLLVCDLGMPTSGGRSFQGGFEVVKKMWKMHMRIPVLMMAERVSAALQARARQMGIDAIVFKPGLSKLDPEQFRADLRAFADRLNKDILPHLGRVSAQPRGAGPERKPPRPGPLGGEEASREIAVLQERLEELRRQTDPTQISLLVMKTAREFFERGVLLLIKDAEARGLAGFGTAPRGENINLLVRDVAVPLSEASAFADVATRRKPLLNVTQGDGKWMAHFYGKVGRFRASNAAILPLLAHREVIALLFGDNPETGREVKRLDALALFIDQAGLALENLFLQRKIRHLEGGAA